MCVNRQSSLNEIVEKVYKIANEPKNSDKKDVTQTRVFAAMPRAALE
jgi:hypothetical protein